MTHKSNNIIPNSHFHKKWQQHIRTWFNQPAKKYRRRMARQRKAMRIAPRPLQKIRPVVRCPTVRYHTKMRFGRGFTLEEVKRVGLCPQFARTIGIPLDCRRLNKSYESLAINVQTLKEYLHRLILFPLSNKGKVKEGPFLREATEDEQKMAIQIDKNCFFPLKDKNIKYKARMISEEDKKFSAYIAVKKARIDLLLQGKRAKKLQEKMESGGIMNVEGRKKKVQD